MTEKLHDCLIVVDMQNDFVHPYGALSIKNCEDLILQINKKIKKYLKAKKIVICTQDWHPVNHVSFKDQNKNGIFPAHCVANTWGSEIIDNLKNFDYYGFIKKGTNKSVDAFSCFFDNNGNIENDLQKVLKKAKIHSIEFAGVALDYCVYSSIKDALNLKFNCYLNLNLTKSIDDKEGQKKLKELIKKGLSIVNE